MRVAVGRVARRMTAIANQPLDVLAERASEAAALDAPADQIGKTVRNLISGPLKDALSVPGWATRCIRS